MVAKRPGRRGGLFWVGLVAVLCASGGGALGCTENGAQGGCKTRGRFDSTGFFRVADECERWWFITPEGEKFYSTGVNHISYQGDYSFASESNPYAETVARKFGSEEAWAEVTAARLQEWGWNTVGAWSGYGSLGKHMPYTIILDLSQADWHKGKIPDYFSSEWAAGVEAKAEAAVPGRRDDPNLVGYFIDNELHWGPDWRVGREIFDEYFALDSSQAGKQAVVSLLRQRHNESIEHFNAAWGTRFGSFDELSGVVELPDEGLSAEAVADRSAFLTQLAERFFSTTTSAIRSRDPNHLVLGVRFVSAISPREAVEVSARYLDVVSVNAYEFIVSPAAVFDSDRFRFVSTKTSKWLEGFFEATGKPILVSEFGFRAKDSGLPNTWPPVYPTLLDQTERADRFEAYAERCFEAPYIVGYHWFEYADQPAAGRFDGENNNWGLVNVDDNPYDVLIERTAEVNRRPYQITTNRATGAE